mgnify:CR=1 FL=1
MLTDTRVSQLQKLLSDLGLPEDLDLELISQAEAEDTARRLAREEGILAGPSSGGALAVALKLSEQLENAVIVSIVCDRGDRYLSTGLFPD